MIRPIQPTDDAPLAAIIRASLTAAALALPGTAFADPQLDHLSAFYAQPGRGYFVAVAHDKVLGGAGFGEYDGTTAELQKLYLTPAARGQGLGRALLARVEAEAKLAGYTKLYLESHHRLTAALHLYAASGYTLLAGPLRPGPHQLMDRWAIKPL
ncbi:GNAT family N-acetyltransferase [Lacticaseibacillus nasuensis]|uniref:GNAT family N-acetyltransferase n=1 Tax=Lacticaseibacillus nasuensis TaxID=944671 RepID=UPI0022474BED|nr:GNAT family N-acetyltransferase [Lacticaseibacillus nasuensis]MCX2455405.1 GNAT family N-acetyltransferase [Lacticaseibacillus nasuensis]